MKKLVLFAVAAIAISLASCGSKVNPEQEAQRIADSIAAEIEKIAADAKATTDSLTVAVDSLKQDIVKK